MKTFDKNNIPMKVEGEVSFGKNEAVREIYKIYAAVVDVNDKIALYGALNGKLLDISEKNIIYYISKGGKISPKDDEINDEINDEIVNSSGIKEQLSKLREPQKICRRYSPAALFKKIMDEFRIFEKVSSENMEIVYYTLELIRNGEITGSILSLKDAVIYIRSLLDGDSGEERCLSLKSNFDAVHLANLHKVKGLEAPIVILAGSNKRNPKSMIFQRIVHGVDNSEGYIFKINNDSFYNSLFIKTDDFDDEIELEVESQNAEMLRLQYVAATRARNVLIVSETKNASKNYWNDLIEEDTPDFFNIVSSREIGKKEEIFADPSELYEEAAKKSVLNDRSSEGNTYALKTPSRLKLISKISAEEEENDSVEFSEYENVNLHRFPALLGTMVHKLMEMLVSSKNKIDPEKAVREIINEYSVPEIESYEKDIAKGLKEVAGKMRNGGYRQKNDLPDDILNLLLMADEVYCEMPFCYKEESETGTVIWNGVMDLVYRTGDNWHIIDYKTNADGKNLDLKYRNQLDEYVKAFKAVTGEDADAKIYHIDI